jgi:hypothetical protein
MKIKVLGIIAFVAIMGLVMVSCSEPENNDPNRLTGKVSIRPHILVIQYPCIYNKDSSFI